MFNDKNQCPAQNAELTHDKDKNEVLLSALTFRRITQHHQSGDIITVYNE